MVSDNNAQLRIDRAKTIVVPARIFLPRFFSLLVAQICSSLQTSGATAPVLMPLRPRCDLDLRLVAAHQNHTARASSAQPEVLDPPGSSWCRQGKQINRSFTQVMKLAFALRIGALVDHRSKAKTS